MLSYGYGSSTRSMISSPLIFLIHQTIPLENSIRLRFIASLTTFSHPKGVWSFNLLHLSWPENHSGSSTRLYNNPDLSRTRIIATFHLLASGDLYWLQKWN